MNFCKKLIIESSYEYTDKVHNIVNKKKLFAINNDKFNDETKCFYCDKKGHWAKHCRNKKNFKIKDEKNKDHYEDENGEFGKNDSISHTDNLNGINNQRSKNVNHININITKEGLNEGLEFTIIGLA